MVKGNDLTPNTDAGFSIHESAGRQFRPGKQLNGLFNDTCSRTAGWMWKLAVRTAACRSVGAGLLLALVLSSCQGIGTYRAYDGERSSLSVVVIEGEAYLRQDWLNRYVDSVRFQRVDDTVIEESLVYNRLEVAPGFHEIEVYFYWDLGNQRGLAQALVQYAATRESLSRTLRFNARAGERYTVLAQPVFGQGRREISNLSHVNFWVEDSDGNVIVTREQGRYIPNQE